MAAVYPAGPDPMMIRSRTPSCSAGGIAGATCSAVTAGPGVGWSVVTGGTTRIVGAAFPGQDPLGGVWRPLEGPRPPHPPPARGKTRDGGGTGLLSRPA